jgi:hypothetical protein
MAGKRTPVEFKPLLITSTKVIYESNFDRTEKLDRTFGNLVREPNGRSRRVT